jgi:hypothetical protein
MFALIVVCCLALYFEILADMLGTLDSPEWRKGPSGPKTLCNACGLRWAKKEKKQKPGTSNIPGTAQGASTGS